jgi:hypothetical protein
MFPKIIKIPKFLAYLQCLPQDGQHMIDALPFRTIAPTGLAGHILVITDNPQTESLITALTCARTGLIFDRIPAEYKVQRVGDNLQQLTNLASQYRLCLICEKFIANSYITEQLFIPLYAQTIPLYLGAPDIGQYLNPARLQTSLDLATINRLMTDDQLWLDCVNQLCLIKPLEIDQLLKP